jgi:lipid intermediate transporter
MPICIECQTPVKTLWTQYSGAGDPSSGHNIRLSVCKNCGRFCDKYVEHDFVVLFIDLVLIKPQVYRHLLFNRLGRSDDKFDPSILRLGTLLILFDVYITWARIEKSSAGAAADPRLSEMPILAQYLFFLTMNVLATVAQHAIIRGLVRVLVPARLNRSQQEHHDNPRETPTPTAATSSTTITTTTTITTPDPAPPAHASPSAISTALLVSSCTKLFPILLVIWPTSGEAHEPDTTSPSFGAFAFRASNYVGWAVLLNNLEALLILLDCGYMIATTLAVSGFVARWVVEGWFLSFVGLARDTGPVGDVVRGYGVLRGWVGWRG